MDHASVQPACFSYDQLTKITDGFSEERKLGSGGYGKVYKGVQEDGETIAVKLLYDMPNLDDEQFNLEFNNLMCLQHHNIVRLIGYCHDTRPEFVKLDGNLIVAYRIHRALCFEYAHNGSLYGHLSDEYSGHDWCTRYGIIKGICNGLDYLHNKLEPPMYHLDLKPANVLLDENMIPKVADFGLSRLFGQEQTKITKSQIGTCGYLPPEYITQNLISKKFDIFSLGVVIIKVLAGPEGFSRCAEMSSQEFVKLVHGNWRARLQEPSSSSEPEPEQYFEHVKTSIEIALRCVETDRHKRPSIRDIVDKMNETETKIRLCWPPSQLLSQKTQSLASSLRGFRRFEYSDLASATDRFSKDRIIGNGFFSTVYKGIYTDENGRQEVAVKKITVPKYVGAELQKITTTRHKNIVKLKGWCCNRNIWNQTVIQSTTTSFVFLVYEFVPNGNLDDHLHHKEETLPWEKRYQIVKGIGSALRYLHHECSRLILHRDIKPRSVRLDYDFNVKLAGFSLSLLADRNSSTVLAEAVGTWGYMDPQCWKDGLVEFNRKSDVYSFGIVLLEIATGMSVEEVHDHLYRRSTALPEMMKSADHKLDGVFEMTEMESVIVLGLKCSDPDSRQRPYMVDAMKFLEEGIELPALALMPPGSSCKAELRHSLMGR